MDFIFSPWLVWFLVGIAVMLAELAIPGFVIIFFGLGCLGGAAVAVFAPYVYSAQVAAFLIVSVASLLTLRKVAMRVFVGRSEGPETEDLGNVPVGARITLDHDMETGRVGRVRFRGTMWDAVSEDRIPAGSDAEIIGVDKSNRNCLKIKKVSRV
jgi:membrane protein implicated in regulation of membrane protease activity